MKMSSFPLIHSLSFSLQTAKGVPTPTSETLVLLPQPAVCGQMFARARRNSRDVIELSAFLGMSRVRAVRNTKAEMTEYASAVLSHSLTHSFLPYEWRAVSQVEQLEYFCFTQPCVARCFRGRDATREMLSNSPKWRYAHCPSICPGIYRLSRVVIAAPKRARKPYPSAKAPQTL